MEDNTKMNDIPKIEKRIDNSIAKVGGSEEGALWVKETLDPFNDEPRRHVGFPDLIVGNSVVQVVRQSVTYVVGATPQDVHIFMDSMDTNTAIYENTIYRETYTRPNNYVVDAVQGIGTRPVGGLTIRSGIVGQPLGINTGQSSHGIPRKFLDKGPTRVLAKAFEITNTTPPLTAGGSLTVYRNATTVPYKDDQCCVLRNAATPTTNQSAYNMKELGNVPISLEEVMLIPGAQSWKATEGCYCVGIMSNQTNDPMEEDYAVVRRSDASTTTDKTWLNTFAQGTIPSVKDLDSGGNTNSPQYQLFSPFFQFGAYLTGLPAGTSLKIDYVWIIERFPDPTNELVTLTNPSPYYDPIAMELYSKSAQHLPHGVKKGANADGDWIKNIADVLSTFGVPGMPLVKGAVDLWNGFNSKNDPARNVGRMTVSPSFANNSPPKRIKARSKKPPPLPPRDYVVKQPVKRVIVVKKRKGNNPNRKK